MSEALFILWMSGACATFLVLLATEWAHTLGELAAAVVLWPVLWAAYMAIGVWRFLRRLAHEVRDA